MALIVLSTEISARDLFAKPLLYTHTHTHTHTHLALRSNLLVLIDDTQLQLTRAVRALARTALAGCRFADCIGLPITLQITARVTWSGWPRIARSHTEISLSLSELLHRGTNLAYKRE